MEEIPELLVGASSTEVPLYLCDARAISRSLSDSQPVSAPALYLSTEQPLSIRTRHASSRAHDSPFPSVFCVWDALVRRCGPAPSSVAQRRRCMDWQLTFYLLNHGRRETGRRYPMRWQICRKASRALDTYLGFLKGLGSSPTNRTTAISAMPLPYRPSSALGQSLSFTHLETWRCGPSLGQAWPGRSLNRICGSTLLVNVRYSLSQAIMLLNTVAVLSKFHICGSIDLALSIDI